MKSRTCTRIAFTLIAFLLSAGSAAPFCCGGGRGMGEWGWCGGALNSLSFYNLPNLTAEQSAKLAQLQKAHIEGTADLKTQLAVKRIELNQLLTAPQSQQDKALQQQQEIAALQSQLQEKCLARQLEVRAILTAEQISQLPYGPGLDPTTPPGWMGDNDLPRGQGYGQGPYRGFRGNRGRCGPCCW